MDEKMIENIDDVNEEALEALSDNKGEEDDDE